MKAETLLVLLMTAAAAQAQQAPSACPQDPLRPIMRSHVMPPNPQGLRGLTTLEAHIGVDGAPDAVKIIPCNPQVGSRRACPPAIPPEADAQARAYAMPYWRWQMPTRNCAVYAVTTRVNVAWHPGSDAPR